MKYWTEKEKLQLLLALQKCGSSNLEVLQKEIPHKTVGEIRLEIDKYSALGKAAWQKKEREACGSDPAMQQWVSIIKKLYLLNRGEVTDVIPRVLKYIALFEEGETKGEINLR